MKKITFTKLLLLTLFSGVVSMSYAQYNEEQHQEYIKEYANLAMQEMRRVGIPASIILATAVLESDAGKSDLAVIGNNHFKIQCETDWNGETFQKVDKQTNEEGKPVLSCFKVFELPEESFVAFSALLADPDNRNGYGYLFEIPLQDYKAWALGLQQFYFDEQENFAEKLLFLIEKFKLYDYDLMMMPEENVSIKRNTLSKNEN